MHKLAFTMLALFVFSIPWENMLAISGLGAVSTLFGAIAFGTGAVAVLLEGKVRRPAAVHGLMLVFVIYTGLTYFWSFSPAMTITRMWTYLQVLLMMWLLWVMTRGQEAIRQLLQAYVLGAWVAVVGTVADYLVSYGSGVTRFAAAGFDANELGLTLALAIPIAWYLSITRTRPVMVWLNRAYLPMAVIAVLLTGSRGAALSAGIAVVIVPLTLDQLNRWKRVMLGAVLLISVYAVQMIIPMASWERLASISTELTQGTLTNRTLIWDAGWDVFLKHPVFGVGSGAFPVAVDTFGMVAHNTFLSLLTENGIVGFLLFSLFLIQAVRHLTMLPRLERRTWAIVLLTWAVGVSALTWEHRKPTWLVMVILALHANSAHQTGARTESMAGHPLLGVSDGGS